MGNPRSKGQHGYLLIRTLYGVHVASSAGTEPDCNAGTQVQFLSWDDPLEKEIATHSSILACRIPWKEQPGRLQSMGL